MEITDLNIHDSVILKVLENTTNDTLDFILDYPVDYETNHFQKKVLRFFDYLNYQIQEIPFYSNPTILKISECKKVKYQIGENKIFVSRTKVSFETNAGKRTLEFSKIELLDY